MNERESAGKIHFANHFSFVRCIHDHEIVRGNRAQTYGVGWISLLRPVPVLARAVQKPRFGEARAKFGNVHTAVAFCRRDGQFERRTFQMIHKDFQIIVLGRAFEKIIRVLHDKLIERRRGSHQNGAGTAATAPSAACTLPSGCNGAWIPGHDRGIERSDVNSKFQRVG